MTTPAFDYVAAEAHITSHGFWPEGSDHAGERSWWFWLLQHLTEAINNYHEWDTEEFWQDRMNVLVDNSIRQCLAQARSMKKVLSLCEASHIQEVMTDPFDDEIYMRLTSKFENPPPLHDDRAMKEYKQRCAQMLKLDYVAEAYLTGAARMVAVNWGAEALDAWRETHNVPGPQA
jgi:hypothetical protein